MNKMNLSYKSIGKADFKRIENKIFFDSRYDRRYGRVDFNGMTVAFGWRSDLIEPVVMKLDSQNVLIAIDQNAVIVNSYIGDVSTRMNFVDNFVHVERFENKIYLATEFCVYQLVGPLWRAGIKYDLPDNFEAFNCSDGRLFALCMDGTKLELPIS